MRHRQQRKKEFCYVNSSKVAKRMIEEGYTVHHTTRNVFTPYNTIYYFNFVPGILNVVQQINWEVKYAKR